MGRTPAEEGGDVRFEDERYVRLFTRDTATWKLLPWQSKCLLPLLLRKLDRAGIADVGGEGLEGLEGIAALVDLPLEIVEAGMPALLKRGVFTLSDGRLLMPNFLAAQEARSSDKLRAQEHRERVRVRALVGQPTIPVAAPIVTVRDGESRCVMIRHTASHGVTPCCAVPSLTENKHVEQPAVVGLSPTLFALVEAPAACAHWSRKCDVTGEQAPAPSGLDAGSAPPANGPATHVAPAAPKPAAANPKQPGLLPVDPPLALPAGPVGEVFAHWQTVMGKDRAKLDPKRRRCIEAAIKSHGLETCLAAIDGCKATPFNMGQNERHTRYDDLTLILRDAKHIEDFADAAPSTRAAAVAAHPGPARPRIVLAENQSPEQRARDLAVLAANPWWQERQRQRALKQASGE